ncbi:phosphoadenosine phosphosulfate reductase family protein, partial [Methanoculleus sp.]|uniref:phosphoadenosine phosphosulfate reductase domain-containing protein n=1 Tax=Methanoculleus sp. TaxID=90427 RepID=UPI0025FB3E47
MRNIAQLQVLPLAQKIQMTISRIRQWYEYWDGEVYLSFSGGKDSQVLLHILRGLYPDVPAVFVNTGMEFPDIVKHVKT